MIGKEFVACRVPTREAINFSSANRDDHKALFSVLLPAVRTRPRPPKLMFSPILRPFPLRPFAHPPGAAQREADAQARRRRPHRQLPSATPPPPRPPFPRPPLCTAPCLCPCPLFTEARVVVPDLDFPRFRLCRACRARFATDLSRVRIEDPAVAGPHRSVPGLSVRALSASGCRWRPRWGWGGALAARGLGRGLGAHRRGWRGFSPTSRARAWSWAAASGAVRIEARAVAEAGAEAALALAAARAAAPATGPWPTRLVDARGPSLRCRNQSRVAPGGARAGAAGPLHKAF